jgi:hypothetical protein
MKVSVIISLALVLMISSISMAAKDKSLTLFLSFEKSDGKKIIDESGNGNDAAISGDAKLVQGKFGKAMSFDGATNWLTIPSNDTLNPEQITIMAWTNPDVIAACHRVFSKDDGTKRNYELSFCESTLEFASWNQAGGRAIPNGPGVKEKEWVHQAGTFDGKNVILYINAEVIGQLPLEGKLQATDVELKIGSFVGSEIYSGLMDDVAIFNRAFTKDEIKSAMTKGIGQQYISVESNGKLATTWSEIKANAD